jgi:hypothetical protein
MRHRNIFDVVAILVAIATIACSGNAHESRADPPSSSTRAPRVGLRLSGGSSCARLRADGVNSAFETLQDVPAATDFDSSGHPRIWVEVAQNSGNIVMLADRVGCSLHFLGDTNDGRFFAPVFVAGHVCCPDVTAAIHCGERSGQVEIVATVVSPTVTPATTPKYQSYPYRSTRQVLSVANDEVVTVSSTDGTAPSRDAVLSEMLDGGFHCAGVTA